MKCCVWGDVIAIKLEAFCDDWGGLSFVSQNFHNIKLLGVDEMSLCGFLIPKVFTKGGFYINRMPNK